MSGHRRAWLTGALVVAVLALGAGTAVVAARAPAASAAGWGAGHAGSGTVGYGMMGGGSGYGMMGGGGFGYGMMGGGGFGLAGDGQPVPSMGAAKSRAQTFAGQMGGLHAGEVMQFSNGYYAELLTTDGHGATEVLINATTGAVSVEYGPAMMWNTRYGNYPTTGTPAAVSADLAVRDAQRWLDAQRGEMTAGPAEAFPGYYTLHTLKDGKVVGMMSVNAASGAVWYHTWHGTFVGMIGE